ncbi:MAG: dihydroneopterin aldolase [Thauera sp.]|jgi:dihydroneopterin aldolase|nr:dihydroneopterin aldolase [Thauera sp.]
MDFIFIEALRVKAWVGIYAREKLARQTIELDLEIGMPEGAAAGDEIANTIDYAVVVARIRAELAERHFNLIETLGEWIAGMIIDDFSAPWVKLRLRKIGVMKDVGGVGVVMSRSRAPQ